MTDPERIVVSLKSGGCVGVPSEGLLTEYEIAINELARERQVLEELLDKYVILSNATSLYIRMEEIRQRIPMGLVRALDSLYAHQCEVEKAIER